MVVIENILEFFFDKVGGKLILGGALIASLITWFAYEQRSIGKRTTAAIVERETTNATHTIRASGARSTDPRVRGIIDPSTKDD